VHAGDDPVIPIDPLWQRQHESPARLYALGLPHATAVYCKVVHDGHLWGLTQEDDRGWTLVVTHTGPLPPADELVPGRLPTLVELYAARRQLVPARPLMVALLTRMTERFLSQLQTTRPGLMPPDSGLPTTVRCVEAALEFTDDLVLGVTHDYAD
jgi:hypothetical protein